MNLKKRILLVDDNVGTVMFIPDILETYGYSAIVVDSGYKAIELIKKNHYSLVICDINMPGMDGVETLKKIKEVAPATVVIMMTAGAGEHAEKKAFEEGAYDIIHKPFEMDNFLNKIFNTLTEPVVLLSLQESLSKQVKPVLREKKYHIVSQKEKIRVSSLIKEGKIDIVLLDADFKREALEEIAAASKEKGNVVIILAGESYEAAGADHIKVVNKSPDVKDILSVVEKAKEKIKKSRSKKVLLVEDDRSLNRTLTGILNKEGYMVDSVYKGEEALEKLERDSYNLAIVDYKLPGMTGIELVRNIKENTDINIIFLSGHATLDLAIEAIREEVSDFFKKPVEIESLLKSMKKITSMSK
ncbi:MAG: response regulator [Elusimicrobiota bacterium]